MNPHSNQVIPEADLPARLAGLSTGWHSNAGGIAKTYRISFDSAIRAVDEIGQVAAELARRPDIDIRARTLTVTTPASGTGDAVTELDLVLASRIDEIMPAYGGRAAH